MAFISQGRRRGPSGSTVAARVARVVRGDDASMVGARRRSGAVETKQARGTRKELHGRRVDGEMTAPGCIPTVHVDAEARPGARAGCGRRPV